MVTKIKSKGYSTKYALTQGVKVVEVVIEPMEPGSTTQYAYEGPYHQQYIVGKTFFEKEDDAFQNAREQAKRKIVSVKKELAKLEKLAISPKFVE